MPQIGPISLPQFSPSAVFPLTRLEYGYTANQQPQIAVHEFASASRKVSQRFVVGNGARKFSIGCSHLTATERESLLAFWNGLGGAWKPFWFDAPTEDGTTTRLTCVFEQPSLTFEALNDCLVSCSLVLVVVPEAVPEYTSSATLNRFPPPA